MEERAAVEEDVEGGAPRVGLVDLEACTTSTTDDACTQNMDITSANISKSPPGAISYETTFGQLPEASVIVTV